MDEFYVLGLCLKISMKLSALAIDIFKITLAFAPTLEK
jgi:hypothetical protein